jgi:hypothetical protein
MAERWNRVKPAKIETTPTDAEKTRVLGPVERNFS